MKRVLIVYYTQTGQLKSITDSIFKSIKSDENYSIDYLKIEPINNYPFPWSDDEFYDVMPESVLGITIPLKKIELLRDDYDLVVLSYQVWYLSPSIPFWSLLQDSKIKELLRGKNVITILGVRNMWVNAHKRVCNYLDKVGAHHVGNIVLSDTSPNLVSVLTVLQYMTKGIKKPYKIFPPFGVRENVISSSTQYGKFIKESIENNNFSKLQKQIVENKGVFIKFSLTVTELVASSIFGKWANFVLVKGKPKDPNRKVRLSFYKVYLLVLIFVVSPISSFIFATIGILFYPISNAWIKKISLLKR